MKKSISRLIYIEVAIKNIAILALFALYFLPKISYDFIVLKATQQGTVLSILGFLMAGGIIGAFELSYTKTNLMSRVQRYLAHASKFFIYLAVCILLWIATKTMDVTGGYFSDWIYTAGLMILCSLFIYDIWDIVCAVEQQFSKGKKSNLN